MNFDDYKNNLPYPAKPARPHISPCSAAECLLLAEQWDKYEALKIAYDKAIDTYRNETNTLMAKFKADVLAVNDLTGHPKAEAVYNLAWEHGHSSGLGEVANYVEEYADLVL